MDENDSRNEASAHSHISTHGKSDCNTQKKDQGSADAVPFDMANVSGNGIFSKSFADSDPLTKKRKRKSITKSSGLFDGLCTEEEKTLPTTGSHSRRNSNASESSFLRSSIARLSNRDNQDSNISSSRSKTDLFCATSSQSKLSLGETSSSSILLAAPTQFAIGDERQQPKRQSSSSIFESPSKTPKASGGKSSLFGAVMKSVSAHQGQSTPKRSSEHILGSPGGFHLMDFVKSVTSPFTAKRSHKSPTPQTPRHQIEWHSAKVHHNRDIGLTDWTLHESLQIQCEPPFRIPPNSFSSPRVLQKLFSLSQSPDSGSSSELWQAGLLYWQHPVNSNNDNNATRKSAVLKLPTLAEPFATKRSLPKESAARIDSTKEQWQQAFQSLVSNWFERIQYLTTHQFDVEDVLEAYFYAVGDGQTTLFRTRKAQESDDTVLEPEIVVSSSTLALRETLRGMEATLWLLAPLEDSEARGEGLIFSEDMLTTGELKPATKASNAGGSVSSPTKADLIELRRAQASRKTVGADISFKMRPKKASSYVARARVPPICLRGLDDCMAFCEVYLNALGQVSDGDQTDWTPSQVPSDGLPVLLCRRLGPFLNSTMRTATVRRQNKSDGEHVTVSGVLLPCAIRNIAGAVIQSMNERDESLQPRNDDDDSSSAHAVFTLSPYMLATSGTVAGPGTIGTAGSKFLNDVSSSPQSSIGDEPYEKCLYGERLQAMVWDNEQPNELAYKVDHVSSL